ncbi:MAG: 4-alpha-glucanotransferase [Chloroflexota bacterium]
MSYKRASGILLHPTSLPGPYGIGDLGPSAHAFVDWLAGTGCTLWQVLPLGPTGYGDSPYQCFSAFAGNPYLISPDFLLRDNFLHPDDLVEKVDFPDGRVDYGRVIPWKLNLLERAFIRFRSDPGPARQDYDRFCAENVAWLPDYALFMALKEANGGGDWGRWPEQLRKRDPASITEAGQRHADAVARFTFYQFVFFRQWMELREHAHKLGIRIIGDLPIFVAYDSADVWRRPELFHLDADARPTVVAGVPPDYFSTTGQLWGNPLYRWEAHQATGYAWWLERFKATLRLVDIVRLDHFRGFAGYWEVPAGNLTAETGRWVPGPGADFFRILDSKLGESPQNGDGLATSMTTLPIIAEDLGEITTDVIALRDQFDLPGMKILQFGFSGPDNSFLPHNYPSNCVTYTGTHDNDTARGWFEAAPAHERHFASRYLRTNEASFVWDLIRAGWSSVAVFALAPMQDLLGLGTDARMNFPSRLGGNWEWRMAASALTDDLRDKIKELNFLYAR